MKTPPRAPVFPFQAPALLPLALALSLLVLLPLLHSGSYGPSILVINRTWTISDGGGGGTYSLDGMLVVNGSGQTVLAISTDPPMNTVQDENGTIRIRHNGTFSGRSAQLRASATVLVDRNSTPLADAPMPSGALEPTNLTRWTPEMAAEARGLAAPSSMLNTIRNLTDWIYGYVDYNESYFGAVRSAEDVFSERQGVCVEYTHLLISLARSLGMETRYVSGYVLGKGWQPHAWAEIYVPGHGWLPADATFGEAGIIDNSHLAMSYGPDHTSSYERLLSRGNLTFSAYEEVYFASSEDDAHGLSVECSLGNGSNATYSVGVGMENNGSGYMFAPYIFLLPKDFGPSERTLALLAPGESRNVSYPINRSVLKEGFAYSVPVSASLGDSECTRSFQINIPRKPQPPPPPEPQSPFCTAAIIPLLLAGFLHMAARNRGAG